MRSSCHTFRSQLAGRVLAEFACELAQQLEPALEARWEENKELIDDQVVGCVIIHHVAHPRRGDPGRRSPTIPPVGLGATAAPCRPGPEDFRQSKGHRGGHGGGAVAYDLVPPPPNEPGCPQGRKARPYGPPRSPPTASSPSKQRKNITRLQEEVGCMRLCCHSILTPFIAVRGGTVYLERPDSPPMILCVCARFEAAAVNEDSPHKMRRGALPALALEY
jgi:hypothetical protein